MENKKIRVAIAGYGNLGKGIESQLDKNPDMELVCIFTRRDPSSLKIKSNVPVVPEGDLELWKNKIDLVFLCGGSATDLPIQGPKFASVFNTIDSFDTHAKALEYSKSMDEARKSDKLYMPKDNTEETVVVMAIAVNRRRSAVFSSSALAAT